MKNINKVYPEYAEKEEANGSFYGPGDYKPLLESFDYEILLEVDDNEYEGDSRLIFKNKDKNKGNNYGILIFGWGSCSGCDALQACNSMKEIEELRNKLHQDIKWFKNEKECLKYFNEHDWKGDYNWGQKETQEFIEKGRELLSKLIEKEFPFASDRNEKEL